MERIVREAIFKTNCESQYWGMPKNVVPKKYSLVKKFTAQLRSKQTDGSERVKETRVGLYATRTIVLNFIGKLPRIC